MRNLYLINKVLVLLLLLGSLQGYAQTTVTGRVIAGDDQTGLPGVSILEKGTTNGAVSDANGNYSVSVSPNATLVFSFVGYATQEVPLNGRSTLDVTLETDVTALSEVVVIGYGEVQKKDATGAVMNISAKDFNKGVLTSPQDLIVGKFAGVNVTSAGGAPGSAASIRIRGGSSLTASNDPLVVIDGFPVDNTGPGGISNPLSQINPNDIETFTILKDASATAIYGSRASNGVVIITTKKGKQGRPQFAYNGNVSVSTPIKFVDVMNGNEYRALVDELAESGISGIDDAAKEKLGDANTDWQKEIFRNAISHDHNISASGSVKNIPYRVSYGYTDQQGILKTTSLKRNSVNLNVNPSLMDGDLKMNFSIKASHIKSDFGDAGAVGNAVAFDPTQPVRTGDDEYGGFFSWLSKGVTNGNSNPVAMLEQTDNVGTAKRFIGSAQFDYAMPFLKDLRANLSLGFDRSDNDGFNRAPIEAGFVHNAGTLIGRNNSYGGEATNKLLDFYLNYVKTVGAHKFDVTAGYGWQHFYREGFNLDDNEVLDLEPRLYKNENYLISFFGRVNYTLNEKYLLTATLRNDGSSRFGPDNQWGLFPAVSLAWRVKDEDFLTSVDALSELKVRAGWGVTGQQDLGNDASALYPFLATYRASNQLAQYPLGGVFYTTLRPQPYDAKIKWEETTTYNIGLDFGFANDRITGSVDVFRKDTEDLLNFVPIPNGVNFSNFLRTNVGDMQNDGIEVTLSYNVVEKQDVRWNVGVNFSSISSEITKLTLSDDPAYQGVDLGNIGVGANVQNHQVGYPASSFFTYQQVYDESGKPVEGLYVNRSGDPTAVVGNVRNKYRGETPASNYNIGLNSRLNHGKFDFSFSSRMSIGNYVYNNIEAGNAFYNNVYSLQHFRNIPKFVTDANFISPQIYSDYYVQNASFFKMDNIGAGYTLDGLISERAKLRVSITVQNAFIISKYKGLDPELNVGTDGNNRGIDNNIYPRPRTFLLGVNLSF
jgi:TonB-dependent starch-binding outer membrane protein SusC